MRNSFGLAVVVVFIFGILAQAQQTPQTVSAPLLFRYRFEPNSQSRYRMSVQMTGVMPLFGGIPVEKASLDMLVTIKVRQVHPNGHAELGFDVESFKAEMDGQTLPLPLERLRESVRGLAYVVTPQGEVIERKAPATMPFNVPIPGVEVSQLPLVLLQTVFPKEAVAPEQEWVFTRAMTTQPNDSPAQFSARWLKEESQNGKKMAVIGQKIRWNRSFKADMFDLPATDDSLAVKQITQTVTGEAQIWFDAAEGMLVKTQSSIQYEQQARLLNPSEASTTPAIARLSAKIIVTREGQTPRETENQRNAT